MPKKPLMLKATVTVDWPNLVEELFEVRDRKLLCRFCGREAILQLEWKDGCLLAGNFGFCECPRSGERRVKLGTIRTPKVVRSDPFPEGDEPESTVHW